MFNNNNNYNTNNNIFQPFKICVRIRPFLQKEIININNNSIFSINNKILSVHDNRETFNNKGIKNFEFDEIYTESDNNLDIFNHSIKPLIFQILNGFNSTILAYGITGTGKTHTIFGDSFININNNYNDNNKNFNINNNDEGIIFYCIDFLFEQIKNDYSNSKFVIKFSYFEIYNENIIDLLNKNKGNNLMIVEDNIKGVYVPDLTEYIITNSNDIKLLINEGNKHRKMSPTNQNQFSSRSHAIIQLNIERHDYINNNNNIHEEIYLSKFLIVDLAGSERGGTLEKGIRREEGANINKSLLSLGNCINILSDKKKIGNFIPYRDSKLTRILKDSLGGNILTLMLACIGPSNKTYEETISTLNYALKAKRIKKKINKNFNEVLYEEENYKDIIDGLKSEIYNLKNIIKNQEEMLKEKNNFFGFNNNNYNSSNNNNDYDFLNNNYEEISAIKFEPDKIDDDSFLKVNINLNNNNNYDNNELNNKKQIINKNNSFLNELNIDNNNNNKINNNCNFLKKNYIINNNNTITNYINNINNKNDNNNNNIENNDIYNNLEKFKIKSSNNLEKFKIKSSNNNNLEILKIKSINIEKYKKYLEEITNTDISFNINSLQEQINNIKQDKNLIENFIESNNNIDFEEEIKKIFNEIKFYYDKYIELINDKLIENIEQNMILKCNLKEINNLNLNNQKNIEILNDKKNNFYSENKKDILKINEEIENIKISINENNKLKNKIYESFQKNIKIKKILKQILLNLLIGLKNKNYNKENEKLIESKKLYESKIKNILIDKNKKEKEIFDFKKKVENLEKKLKEKDDKIYELKLLNNNTTKNNNNNNISYKINQKKSNYINQNYLNFQNNKIINYNNNNNLTYNNNNFINNNLSRKNSTPLLNNNNNNNTLNNKHKTSNNLNSNRYDKKYINIDYKNENNYYNKYKNKLQKRNNSSSNLKIIKCKQNNLSNNINNPKSFITIGNNNNQSSLNKYLINSNIQNQKKIFKSNLINSNINSDINNNTTETNTNNNNIFINNNEITNINEDLINIKNSLKKNSFKELDKNNKTNLIKKDLSKFISIPGNKINPLNLARYENRVKNEKNINLEKAEDFINQYQKSKNNNTISSKNMITQSNNNDELNNNNKINLDGLEFSNSLKCSNCNCIELKNDKKNQENSNNENIIDENEKILDVTEKDYLLENIKTPNLSKFLNVKK